MELSELSELDFAAWKNPWSDLDDEAPDRDETLDGLLTLRKLLEMVADYERRVEVAVETKHPTRYGGLVEKRSWRCCATSAGTSRASPVRVMSFSFTALQRVERLAPDVQLVQLIDRAQYWPMLRRVIGKDWIVGPGIAELREHPKLGRRITKAGHDIHVWTVNTEEDLRVCQDNGVKAVISDRPAYMMDLLDK